MKKIYEAPTTLFVQVGVQTLMAGSIDPVVTLTEDDPITSGDQIGSRRGSIWGDDDDDF